MSESTRYIHIRNWDRFQHPDATRNRKTGAPWIKDYTAQLLDDDWLALTCRQKGILQGLRLLYAANRGLGLGSSPARLGLKLGDPTVRTRDLEALNKAGFIEFSASKVASKPARLEVEREEEKNKGLTVASNGQGPRFDEKETDAGKPRRHPPPTETHANGSQPAPSPSNRPLQDAIRNELAKIKNLPV